MTKSKTKAAATAAASASTAAPSERPTFDPLRLPRAQVALAVAVAALSKFPSRPVPQTLLERVDTAAAEVRTSLEEVEQIFASAIVVSPSEAVEFDFSDHVQKAIEKLLPDAIASAAKEAVEAAAAEVDKRIEGRIAEAQRVLDEARQGAGDDAEKGAGDAPQEDLLKNT